MTYNYDTALSLDILSQGTFDISFILVKGPAKVCAYHIDNQGLRCRLIFGSLYFLAAGDENRQYAAEHHKADAFI
jgi:hypothetical protein